MNRVRWGSNSVALTSACEPARCWFVRGLREVKMEYAMMIDMVKGFRMLHKKKVAQYLQEGSAMQTAGFHIDALPGAKANIVDAFKNAMQVSNMIVGA